MAYTLRANCKSITYYFDVFYKENSYEVCVTYKSMPDTSDEIAVTYKNIYNLTDTEIKDISQFLLKEIRSMK